MRGARVARAVVFAGALAFATPCQRPTVVVGGKNFTESGVLAEIMAQLIEAHTDLAVERRLNLGGTKICWTALLAGEIDLYAEYTGTGWAVLLKEPGKITDPLRAFFHVQRRCRAEHAVAWLEPFGLNNTYALAMRADRAAALGITSISDLLQHRGSLKAGLSIEFTSREDGWLGLVAMYGLDLGEVRSVEHGLAYNAIVAGDIDLIDAYSTDGKLLRYDLCVLDDDRRFFPPYHAAPVVRDATLQAHPELAEVLGRLSFRLPDDVMQGLNYIVEARGLSFAAAARAFLEREGLVDGAQAEDSTAATARAALVNVLKARPSSEPTHLPRARPGFFAVLTARAGETVWLAAQHLGLTLLAVLLAALLAIPLGIFIIRRGKLRQLVLGAAGVLQTIPSLALLAFMIPVLGLGVKAAIAALLLYALLPILRNTYTGIVEVDPDLVEAARGIGMRPRETLMRVQLPLAMRTIMAGIRTATVISIGVATLAAFIGAGGLGEPILTGLYLDDTNLILSGAIPAALLAVAADLGLGRLERALQARGGSGAR